MSDNDFSNWVEFVADEEHIRRERAKARELKKTPYFRNLLASGICHYCKKHFPPSELTFDHVVPLARGGRSTRNNLVVACRECNHAKRCFTPAEMIMRQIEQENKE